MGYSPTEFTEFTEPPTEMSSHGFLLRRVWHLAIPTPPAMGYSPTEYTEFTEPPAEMSSHGFLLRRVCHLAIPTPPAMGYSPTEYAEFTEPPAEMSFHGFHRFTQILRVRYSPTEFTEFTEFGSVGMAGMPYPPTSVRICAICGRLFSARRFRVFRAFCGNIFSPTDGTDLHRCLGCAVLPQDSQNSQNLAAWVWQECHTLLHLWESFLCQKFLCVPCVLWEYLFSHGFHRFTQLHPLGWQRGYGRDAIPSYICAHPCHLWKALLCKRFCVFGAFRGRFFTACSVGAAETAAPPGGIHRSSVQISPFHLEPSLLHVLPVLWVRLRNHLRLVDAQPREHNRRRCERHRHAVVVVGVDRL